MSVITQDVRRQQTMPAQVPLSDAYIAGMPAKRRKVLDDIMLCYPLDHCLKSCWLCGSIKDVCECETIVRLNMVTFVE